MNSPLGHVEFYGTLSGSTCLPGTGFDLNGNVIKFTDRRGKVTTFQYDAVNRRTSAGFGPGQSSITYTYDAADRLVQVTDSTSGTITRVYDNLDRVISEVTPQGSVSYSYDAAGRRTAMSVGGQTQITYGYDNANRLTSIQQGSATVTIVPDSDGRRQSVTLPNGVKMAYVYDAASQLQSIGYTQGATGLGSLTYAYDAAGRRMGVGGTFARTNTPQAVPAGSAPNANNQLTQWNGKTLTYDLNGNLTGDGTNTYTWNARNQLTSISTNGTTIASFQYDAFGRRVSKTVGGTTQFLYDGVNPVQELSGTSAPANLLTGGVDEYFQRTDSAGARNFLTDALGSTLELTDSTGAVQTSYTFEPFGNTSTTGATTTNSLAFTGRELDPTGLYLYRARYYNPSLGRFISEDPLEFRGGDVNLYAYVWNSPLNFIDPLGEGGIGVTIGGSVEAGVIAAGAGATGSFGGGFFFNGLNPSDNPSVGGFASGGAFAGGPGWGKSAPSCPSKNPWVLGGFAGGGLNVVVTNANNVLDLSGPFKTISLNLGWGVRVLSLQVSIGQNASGKNIWEFSYGGPLGPFPTGGGYGVSLSAYNTNTVTTSGRGCGCK